MPWTFAHPAAVLPIRRYGPAGLSFPALVVGSLVPDAGYYLGQLNLATTAHTIGGLFAVCLPTGLVLLLTLCWLRGPLSVLLPQPHREMLAQGLTPPAARSRHVLILILSLLLGAATHLAWDSFTHASGFMVEHMAVLRRAVFEVGDRTMYVYSMLQHASTLGGLFVLLLAYRSRLRGKPLPLAVEAEPRDALRRRLLAAIAGLALAAGAAIVIANSDSAALNLSTLLVRGVVYATSSFVLFYLVVALIWFRWSRNHLG